MLFGGSMDDVMADGDVAWAVGAAAGTDDRSSASIAAFSLLVFALSPRPGYRVTRGPRSDQGGAEGEDRITI
jgi:hypothetical protein